jgi:outer membrane protein OmpU
MNKLTKVGLSALCGSLAAVSAANAGEMTVTGGVDMSWMSKSGGDATTGNPIGMGSNLTFSGSGELDNGWAFGVTVAMLNQDAYSTTVVNLDMNSLGSLNFNQGDSGNGIKAIDDKMPTAWEEPWGMGLGTGIQLVKGVGTQVNVQYSLPTVAGISLKVASAPDMGAAQTNDKGSSGGTDSDNTGAGYDATLNINPSFGTEILSGLNLYVGGHMTEHHNQTAGLNNRYEGVGGITYSLGPIALGYAASGISTGNTTTATDVDYYKNSMYGVSFNVNDDLSVSYGSHTSRQGVVNETDQASVDLEVESWQIAYTMGGASIRYAKSDVDNAAYQTAAAYDKEAKVLSVSLAF